MVWGVFFGLWGYLEGLWGFLGARGARKRKKAKVLAFFGGNLGGLGGVLAASWAFLASKIVPKPQKNRCQNRLKI